MFTVWIVSIKGLWSYWNWEDLAYTDQYLSFYSTKLAVWDRRRKNLVNNKTLYRNIFLLQGGMQPWRLTNRHHLGKIENKPANQAIQQLHQSPVLSLKVNKKQTEVKHRANISFRWQNKQLVWRHFQTFLPWGSLLWRTQWHLCHEKALALLSSSPVVALICQSAFSSYIRIFFQIFIKSENNANS